MVVNSIAAALKRLYASVVHAKQVSLFPMLSFIRAEGLKLARFVKAAPRQSSQIVKLLTSMHDTEMLRRKPAQKPLGSPNLIKLYNMSNHLDVIFSGLLPILRVTGVLMRQAAGKKDKN